MTPTLFTALNFSVIASSTTAAVPLKRSSDVVITSSPNLHCLETEAVLAASKKLLGASVAMIGDVARSTHHLGGYETAIELKGLTIREIVAAPLSEEDRAKGVTRRYLAHVSYKSHRIWDEPMRSWTEWRETSYGFFPSQVIVEEIAGNFSARANRIADFVPGIETGLALPS
ncbi:hypothetical protein OJ996_11075 [Luteolibacter sp. GHJ8]|uniref:Uncharacterized protein n=1 Tax=Luteolibacter rhizosphaerae TaxID=2989719 RepID=A0ABT3G2P3_9BACT|nr:hypothetical protein [Luteolibacter rhizosphaerae]MCW1914121.1 hypothetical protein [Luteolibacter rhizosphaerae]